MKKFFLCFFFMITVIFPCFSQSIIKFGAGAGININKDPSQFNGIFPFSAFIEYRPSIDSYFKCSLKQAYISSNTPKNSGIFSEGTTKHFFTGLEASYLLEPKFSVFIGIGLNYNYYKRDLSSDAKNILSDRGLEGKESLDNKIGIDFFANFEPFKPQKMPVSILLEVQGNFAPSKLRTSVTDTHTGITNEKTSEISIYYLNFIIYLLFDFSKF
jgi:hypothetical protein